MVLRSYGVWSWLDVMESDETLFEKLKGITGWHDPQLPEESQEKYVARQLEAGYMDFRHHSHKMIQGGLAMKFLIPIGGVLSEPLGRAYQIIADHVFHVRCDLIYYITTKYDFTHSVVNAVDENNEECDKQDEGWKKIFYE